jgi:hypothetical protein
MTEAKATEQSTKFSNIGRTNLENGSIQKVVIEEKQAHFDDATTYHFSVKLYFYEMRVPRPKKKPFGDWKEILPFPQEVSGQDLNMFVSMIYGEANSDSYEGMKACVDATIRRIGNNTWGAFPMNINDVLKPGWFEAMKKEKYKKSLALKLKGRAVKAHNLAYKAVCTVVKETNGAARLTYPYNQWLSAASDKKPGGVVIGGNKFRDNKTHSGRPD